MSGIRLGRMIAAGLVAGVVINVGEFALNLGLLGTQWSLARQALGLGEESPILYVAWGFLNGLIAAAVYAAIRPRFVPGVRTALLAGFFVWSLSSLGVALIFLAAALYPPSLVWTVTLGEFVLLPLATVIGASIYREEAPHSPATPVPGH